MSFYRDSAARKQKSDPVELLCVESCLFETTGSLVELSHGIWVLVIMAGVSRQREHFMAKLKGFPQRRQGSFWRKCHYAEGSSSVVGMVQNQFLLEARQFIRD